MLSAQAAAADLMTDLRRAEMIRAGILPPTDTTAEHLLAKQVAA